MLSRRAAVWVALALLALPAAAYLQRVTVFFSASFDGSSAPSGPLPADVGQFGVPNPITEFTVVPGPGGGQLKIEDTGTTTAAVLDAQFKKLFKGQDLDVSWTVQASQLDSALVLQIADSGDSGIIDCTLDDDGTLDVDGFDTGFSYQAGVSYQITLSLLDPLVGLSVWKLQVASGGLTVFESTGIMNSVGALTAKSLKLMRPANSTGGKFLVDNLMAASASFSASN